MVQEKANVTENTTCTTYCRTWWRIEKYHQYEKYSKARVNKTGLNIHSYAQYLIIFKQLPHEKQPPEPEKQHLCVENC